jgi:hypothetical protein
MSKDSDPLSRLIRENIEMASNQIKHNAEMGIAMTYSFIKMSGALSKETSLGFESARKEMMATAERMRKEMMGSAEKMRDSFSTKQK